jgi:hypothetical protein
LRILQAVNACFEAKFASIIPEYTHISTVFRGVLRFQKTTCWLLVDLQIFAFAVIVCYCHSLLLISKGFVWTARPRGRVVQGNFYQQSLKKKTK